MAKSEYFSTINYVPEQNLIFDINQEIINIHGVEIYIIPNAYANVDLLFGEDRKPNLTEAVKIVAIIKDPGIAFDGEPMFSKFGFYNPAQINIEISRKEWTDLYGTLRPTEGSLVYIPAWDVTGPADFLKIDYVDKFKPSGFQPTGITPSFTLQCSKWVYSSETIATGVPEIDSKMPEFSNDAAVNLNLNPTEQNDAGVLQTTAAPIITFTEDNPFGVPQV